VVLVRPARRAQPDAAHDVVSVEDPSVFWYDGRWHVYMTTPHTSGAWELGYTSFADWSQAADAPQTFLDTNPNIGDRYAAAPQVFYFQPDDTWYLVFQSPNPTYYTTKNRSDPMSWEGPGYFMESEPPILRENKGDGTWLDFWTICDDATCHLFFSDGNGHVYRASTSVDQFPNGFGNTETALSDPDPDRIFEDGNVYRVGDTGPYLLEEAMATGCDWRRYFRAWTPTPPATTRSCPGTWVWLPRPPPPADAARTSPVRPVGLRRRYGALNSNNPTNPPHLKGSEESKC